jgi:hypothetical protein
VHKLLHFLKNDGKMFKYYKRLDDVLTLLLPDSNFKRRCVRHNILTSSIVDVLGQEKALFVLATTLVQYMPTIWTFPFFCILIVDWLVVKTLLLLPVLIYMQCICHEIQWILPKIDNFISTNTFCFIHQIIFTIHKIQSNKIFLNINLQYFVLC